MRVPSVIDPCLCILQSLQGNIVELQIDVDGGWGRKILVKGNFGAANKW